MKSASIKSRTLPIKKITHALKRFRLRALGSACDIIAHFPKSVDASCFLSTYSKF